LNVEKKKRAEKEAQLHLNGSSADFQIQLSHLSVFGEAENGKMVNKSLKRFSGTCKQTARLQLVAFKQ
jgi:alanine racemase